MRDEFYGAAWAAHHDRVSTGLAAAIDKLVSGTANVFDHLHHHYFDAPWDRPSGGRATGSR